MVAEVVTRPRQYPRGDIGRWGRPPMRSQVEIRRWRAFAKEIDHRIAGIRAREGIDGRIDDWCTFDPPLPRQIPRERPVRLRLAPAATMSRDARGRLLPREARAS